MQASLGWSNLAENKSELSYADNLVGILID